MNTTGILIQPSSGFDFSGGLIWGLVGFGFLFFAVMSALFMYHWKKYEVDTPRAWAFVSAYFIVGGGLLVVMLISAIKLS